MLISVSLRRLAFLLSPLFVLTLSLPSFSKDGRDFAGLYAVSNRTDVGDNAGDPAAAVKVTLTVQVFNHSDLGDIKAPVLALLESGPSHALLGKFSPVKVLPANRDVVVSGSFTLSKDEFQRWGRRGIEPKVIVIYRDETGRVLRQNVQLSRRPLLPPPTGD